LSTPIHPRWASRRCLCPLARAPGNEADDHFMPLAGISRHARRPHGQPHRPARRPRPRLCRGHTFGMLAAQRIRLEPHFASCPCPPSPWCACCSSTHVHLCTYTASLLASMHPALPIQNISPSFPPASPPWPPLSLLCSILALPLSALCKQPFHALFHAFCHMPNAGCSSACNADGPPLQMYHYGHLRAQKNKGLYKFVLSQLAAAVRAKYEKDPHARACGSIVCAPVLPINALLELRSTFDCE
jgi:hypothetical protein